MAAASNLLRIILRNSRLAKLLHNLLTCFPILLMDIFDGVEAGNGILFDFIIFLFNVFVWALSHNFSLFSKLTAIAESWKLLLRRKELLSKVVSQYVCKNRYQHEFWDILVAVLGNFCLFYVSKGRLSFKQLLHL